MCGLVGWVGGDPTEFNYSKLHTLGVLNETRGKHSCGISFDREIWTGIDKEKLWRDFSPTVKDMLDEFPLRNPVVIGHTRWATGGAHNAANAHPFGFGDDGNGGYQFCGVHNGSLIDYEDLAKKYQIPVQEGKKKKKRKKIDSEILLEILFIYGYEVLNEYLGAAALIWYDVDEPDVMYCYHGRSKNYANSHTEIEERPLFWLQDGTNSLYISSLEDSLHCINDNGGEIGKFEYNKIYKIKAGDLVNAEILEIDRSKCYQKRLANTTSTYHHGHHYNYHRNNHNNHNSHNKKEEKEEETKETTSSSLITDVVTYDLHKEKVKHRGKMETFNSLIYYNRLRYWQGEKVITGVFAPMKHNPMCFLGPTASVARENYEKFHDKNKFSEKPMLFFFYKGVALETELDYKVAVDKQLDTGDLSHMSKYPILDLGNLKSKIIKNNKQADDFFLPYLSTKIYTVVEGECVGIDVPGDKIGDYTHALLETDKKILEQIDPRFKKKESNREQDNTIVLDAKSELEASVDDCVVEISESVEDEDIKKEALGIFEIIRQKIKDTFKELWEK